MPALAGYHFFAYEAEQHSKRPPVILIHGVGGNHLIWPPQIRRLADERVYALDLPGHGQSEGTGRHSIDEYADDILAFIKALKIRTAVLAGISMGSAIALTVALKYPKTVTGLALLGGGAKMRVASKILETAGNSNTFRSTVGMINENCFSANTSPSLVQLSKQNMLKIRPPVLLGDFLACNEFDVTDQLEKIKIPALIVCGSKDKMMPLKYSQSLHEGLANSQLQVLENAGHMVMLEQPARVASLLKKFMDELPLRSVL
ncbi:MAG: alpha/beta fold hydrolase [Anaerolineales bacterium]